MKNKITLSSKVILFLIVLFSFKGNTNILVIGGELPLKNVKLLDVTGNKVSMKDAKKQNGLLVMFSCNSCPFVIKNQQRTKDICKYALENKIGVMLINSNEGQRNDDESYLAMQNYSKQQGYNWYYVVDKDDEIANEFGARRTPECFLFNKGLRLNYHGAIDDNPGDEQNATHHYLKEAITEITGGKEVSIKESRSVGCAIKRKA